jgi:hypothetical protein
MTNQSLSRTYTTGDFVPQGRSAQERAEVQLRKLASVSLTVIAAIDETHTQAEAYCLRETGQQGSRNACSNALPWCSRTLTQRRCACKARRLMRF